MVQVVMESSSASTADPVYASAAARPQDFLGAPGKLLTSEVLRVENVRKEYVTGRGRLVLFDDISFSVAQGDLMAIVGESGAGKSTLLHILGALDSPTSGDIYFASTLLKFTSLRQASTFRNREVGYVWQFHYLLPEFTAQENVAMPLLARGEPRKSAMQEAEQWLNEVELGDRADHRSGELSGGEQQRVSLARALITQPKVLLADEPTGDLDGRTAGVVFSLLERLHRNHGLTSLIVTHNTALAGRCDRVLRLDKSRISEETPHVV
jgi:lipoprotein-releasing system ATP-binding protein